MGNNYCTPVLVYGIHEPTDNKILNKQFLKIFNIKRYPTYIHNSYGYNFIYGIPIKLNNNLNDVAEFSLKEKRHLKKIKNNINNFMEYMKKNYEIDFKDSDYHLCLDGKYNINHHIDFYLDEYDDLNFIDLDKSSLSELEDNESDDSESEESELEDSETKKNEKIKENNEYSYFKFW
jgi:hypothetical protein